ncbi:MAG: dolichol kinase [Candidatus Kapabacteria bacterium]|nr:dolichol kinase [Candidatus Kapabacteria bacterium]
MTGNKAQITYSSEIARKGIHLASLLIPIIYLQLEHSTGLLVLVSMTAASIALDALMHYHEPSRKFKLSTMGHLLRPHERHEDRFLLTGASWVLISATSTFLVFPTLIAVTAFSVLIVSDTCAALVGRRYGSRPFLDKSAVGAVTFILSSMVVVVVYGKIYGPAWPFFAIGALSSIVAGVVEAGSIRMRLDDNLSVPFSFAIVMWALGVLLVYLGFPDFINTIS